MAILANADSSNAGAQQDLEDWHSFLVSTLGGGWLDGQEVHIVLNPAKEDIQNLVRSAVSDDYVIVVFLGRGELRKDRLGFPETFLFFNDSSFVSERELNPRNDRCSIFIDIGRNVKSGKSVALQPRRPDEIRLSRARKLFDSDVARAEKGCVKIYAPLLSREAPDNHSFSATLIEQSVEWAQRNHGTLDLHQAISLTANVFERDPLLKRPRYQGGRRLNHFPFAVNP